jgi:hypothetical protein
LDELREQAEHGGPIRLNPTFEEVLDAYIDWHRREAAVGVAGADAFLAGGSALAVEAMPAFGAFSVGALADGRAINNWEIAMIDAGRRGSELRPLHETLLRVLGWGLAHGWISRLHDPRDFLAKLDVG